MRVRAILAARESPVRGVRLGHRLADQCRLGEDLRLPRVRLERLALFEAERPQHRMEEDIAWFDRLTLDDVVEPLPILHPTRRRAAPGARADVEDVHRRRTVALRVRIHLQLRERLLRAGWVFVSEACAEKDVEGRRLAHDISADIVWRLLSRREYEIGAGRFAAWNRDLPAVADPALNALWRDDHDQWAR